MTVRVPNRFDNVASAAGSGVDVETIIALASTPEDTFGDEDGDYPKPAGRSDIGTPKLEETIENYDLDRPTDIQIKGPTE
jgi:hypothetical protein